MNKILSILIIILLLLTLSCTQREEIKIDGCEYIKTISFTGEGPVENLTHKGNCKNPIHKSKK